MTRRPRAALLGLGAVAVVVAAAWWLTVNPPLDDGAASAHEVAPPEPSFPTEIEAEVAEHAPPSTDEPLPTLDHDAHDSHDDSFTNQDLWAHISDPANSDLPPELFAELSQLAADIVRADATGQGRHRWPDHWATDNDQQGSRAEPCCTDITIHAAGAFTHPSDPGAVQITVIWTGSVSHKEYLVDQVSQLRIRRSARGWRLVK